MLKLRTSAFLTLLGGVIQKIIPFGVSIVIAKFVGQDYFAEFSFALNTANTIAAVCAMGMNPSILIALSEVKMRSVGTRKQTLRGLLFVTFFITLAVIVVSLIVKGASPHATINSVAYGAIVILAPALVLMQATYAMSQGLGRYVFSMMQSLSLFFLVLVAVIGVIKFGSKDTIHIAYAWSYFFVGLVVFALLFGFSQKITGGEIDSPSPKILALLLQQLPFAGYTAVWMVAIYLCNFEVARNYTSLDLAIYNAGFQWYTILLLVPSLLGGVLIPYFFNSGSGRSVYAEVRTITGLYVVLGIPLIACLIYLTPTILKLYSIEPSDNAVNVFRVMALSGGVAIMIMPALQFYLASKRFKVLYAVSGVWAIIALSGALLFAKTTLDIAFFFFSAYVGVALLVAFDFFVSIKWRDTTNGKIY